MASIPLDQSQDIGGEVRHRLEQLVTIPAFVKNAGWDSVEVAGDPEQLETRLYADEARRALPCHTKAATFVSALYHMANQAEFPPNVTAKMANFVRIWDLGQELSTAAEQWQKRDSGKEADLPDRSFALVIPLADGTSRRMYPLRNAAEVVKAAGWLAKHASELPFEDRHNFAVRTLEAADEFAADIDTDDRERLQKCAGLGFCTAASARDAWRKRAAAVIRNRPDVAQAANEVADSITDQSFDIRDVDTRLKMAALMDDFDRANHLTQLYSDNGGLEKPEDCLFYFTEKRASEMVDGVVVTPTGNTYDKRAVALLPAQTLQDWLGSAIVEKCGGLSLYDPSQLIEQLPGLPLEQAAMFDKMAAATGMDSVWQRGLAQSLGLSEAELAEMAAEYAAGG